MFRRAALLVLILSAPLLAGDWPQWRGPKRDGHAESPKLPAVWPKEAPKPLWTAEVGTGQSSPVVAKGRLFIMGRQEGDETCFCLNADTGKLIWKRSYPCPFKPSDPSAGTGPKSTPTVDGDRVTMLGVAGMLHCFEVAKGKVRWKHDLRKLYWGVAKDKWGDDAYSTCCGAAASPLIDGERLILPVGGKKAGAFVAFDRKSGEVSWRSSLIDRSSYASPTIAAPGGKRQLVAFTGLRLVGLSLDGKSLLWEYPFPAAYEQTMITPIVWKNLVVVAGENKPTVALKIDKIPVKGKPPVEWTNKLLRCYTSTPVVFKDHLLGLNQRGQLVCVELKSGKTTWSGGNLGRYASLVVAGEQVLALGLNEELLVLEANPKKMVRKATWTVTRDGPTWSHLAVVGSRLYLKDSKNVLCFELPKK